MEKYVSIPSSSYIKLVKWKVKVESPLSSGTLLCLYQHIGEDDIHKFKASEVGTVIELLLEEGDKITPGDPIMKVQGCKHPIVMKDMCAECGADLREELGVPGERRSSTSASVAMVHSIPELIVSEEQAVELGKADEERLLKNRKLVLLVDLDETVLHTTNDNVPANLKDVYHFQLWHGRSLLWYHSKFRPGTQKFLENISKMFELHICTFGARMYAHTMARYLDPEGKFFSHRILSRDECFDARSKTANLKSLFPCGDAMVCIIDDREEVWNFAPNMIRVKPYIFFDGTADINAPPGLDKGAKGDTNESVASKPKRNVKVIRIPKKKSQSSGGNAPAESEQKEETCEQSDTVNSDDKEVKTDSSVSEELADSVQTQSQEITDSSTLAKSDVEVNECNNKMADSETVVSTTTLEENMEVECVCDSGKSAQEEGKAEKLLDSAQEVVTAHSIKEDTGNIGEKRSVLKEMENDRECIESIDALHGNLAPTEFDKETITSKDGDNETEGGKSADAEKQVLVDNNANTTKGSEGNEEECEEIIEWEDVDDYLLHLEDILTRIHTVYFKMHDELKQKSSKGTNTKEDSPNLKKIIPYVKKKVLQGVNIVFSSMVPMNQPLEGSRAYHVAKSLGAEVHTEIKLKDDSGGGGTTHLVAAKLGTQKVKAAQKMKGIYIVQPDWLWSCNDRWERVDERLFFLDEKHQIKDAADSPDMSVVKERMKRKAEDNSLEPKGLYDPETGRKVFKKAKSSKENNVIDSKEETLDDREDMEVVDEQEPSTSAAMIGLRRFSDTINPMYTFSKQDVEDMDKEVEDILSGESESEDEKEKTKTKKSNQLEDDLENSDSSQEAELELRRKVLGNSAESSSDDSMSGDYPKGWKKKSPTRSYDDNSHLFEIDDPGEANLALLKAAQSSPHYLFAESESSSDGESIGSVDEEMAAAIEKELFK